mmetsp:Transcript_33454/g.71313  ORF Transcript_33454/g.71313 Transcript_33454/m.71313 type:complete len:236 (-) Transcript_33454:286-993(-)
MALGNVRGELDASGDGRPTGANANFSSSLALLVSFIGAESASGAPLRHGTVALRADGGREDVRAARRPWRGRAVPFAGTPAMAPRALSLSAMTPPNPATSSAGGGERGEQDISCGALLARRTSPSVDVAADALEHDVLVEGVPHHAVRGGVLGLAYVRRRKRVVVRVLVEEGAVQGRLARVIAPREPRAALRVMRGALLSRCCNSSFSLFRALSSETCRQTFSIMSLARRQRRRG